MNVTLLAPRAVDLELAQCYIRLFVPIPVLILWFGFWALHAPPPQAMVGLVGTGVFCLFALAHWAHVKRYPGFYPLRRTLAIMGDQTGCFMAMFLTGELGAIVAFLCLWISLGNGMRFGVPWMALSATLASAGLIAVGIFSDYWSQYPIWIISLILLNTAIPLYVASLIHGFHHSRDELVRYAGEMEAMALKDSLTGLPNRTALFDEIDKAAAHARRTEASVAALYFDLDGFKQVNDTLGHAPGDMLLVEAAKRANDALRCKDILARIGGDEFVVLLQTQDGGTRAHAVAERILQSIAAIREIAGSPIKVTASVGIVVASGVVAVRMGAEQIIHEADRNMYLAKKRGKNRIGLSRLDEVEVLALQA